MKNRETGALPPPDDNPLDRPFDGPIATIPGIDIDVDAEAIQRVWGIRPVKVEHASSDFERAVEHADWRSDARREGRYSKGHAHSTYRVSSRIDGALGFPAAIWLLAAVDQDPELAAIAVACWIGALLIWTPWTLWRVWSANPKGDVGRAGGFLTGAWALLVVLIPAAANLISLLVAFAPVYALGLLLVYLALMVPSATAPRAPSAD